MRWTLLFICLFATGCTQQRATDVRQSASTPTITTQAAPQPTPAYATEAPARSPAPAANTVPKRIEAEPQRAAPVLADQEITQQLIARSLASYPGSCPCPYNSDRAGRRCGGRSAYSRPCGYAPLCFESDITSDMIDDYRRKMVTALR
jgi:hypothetical protein